MKKSIMTVNNIRRFCQVLPIILLVLISCEYERVEPIDDGDRETVTFIKANGADPNLEQNQDRITENVWITRGNRGQIYNARINSSANKQLSPVDTEWALGTLEELEGLTFAPFRETIQPKDVVGKDLVLHLITDDIYINVRFTAWSSGREGGFAYVRDSLQ